MIFKPKPIEPRINQGLFIRIIQNVLNGMKKTGAYDMRKIYDLQTKVTKDFESACKVLDELLKMLKQTKDRVRIGGLMKWHI